MADSVSTEINSRPHKIPKLQKSCEGSRSKERELRLGDLDDDEYLRQYLMYYYQSQKSQGFTIDWEQFDYVFHVRSLDHSPPLSDTESNAELIRNMTLTAIDKHNQAEGTQLAFVEHVEANYAYVNGFACWITFWARDMSSPTQDSKIYQAKVWSRTKLFKIHIFRLKPTDEEIASVEVEPPSPRYYVESDKRPIVFCRAGPGEDPVPGTPFVFSRNGGEEFDYESDGKPEEDECID